MSTSKSNFEKYFEILEKKEKKEREFINLIRLEIEKIFKKIIFPSSAKSTNSKYFYIPQKTSKPILVRVSDHQTITWETNLNDYSKYINIKYNSITLKKFRKLLKSENPFEAEGY